MNPVITKLAKRIAKLIINSNGDCRTFVNYKYCMYCPIIDYCKISCKFVKGSWNHSGRNKGKVTAARIFLEESSNV